MEKYHFIRMKPRIRNLIGILWLCSVFSLYAAPVILGNIGMTFLGVTGKITSAADGQPLPGATVMVKGTPNGVVADFDGNYEIEVTDPANAVLVISFVGFKTTEIPINNQSTIGPFDKRILNT